MIVTWVLLIISGILFGLGAFILRRKDPGSTATASQTGNGGGTWDWKTRSTQAKMLIIAYITLSIAGLMTIPFYREWMMDATLSFLGFHIIFAAIGFAWLGKEGDPKTPAKILTWMAIIIAVLAIINYHSETPEFKTAVKEQQFKESTKGGMNVVEVLAPVGEKSEEANIPKGARFLLYIEPEKPVNIYNKDGLVTDEAGKPIAFSWEEGQALPDTPANTSLSFVSTTAEPSKVRIEWAMK